MSYDIRVEDRTAIVTASVRKEIAQAEVGPWVQEALGRIFPALGAAGLHPTGPMYCRYHTWEDDRTECEVGFVISGPAPEGLDASELPAGRSAVLVHTGPYDGLRGAYEVLSTWIEQNETFGVGPYELYIDDPQHTDPEELRTEIIWPLA
jgi:effector-binding domain-containing protein